MPRSKQEAARGKKRSNFQKEAPLPVPIPSSSSDGSPGWFFYTGCIEGASVVVTCSGDMDFLYKMGFFGKGTLSRGQPNFNERKQKVHLQIPQASGSSEFPIFKTEQIPIMSKRVYLAHRRYEALEKGRTAELSEILYHEEQQHHPFNSSDDEGMEEEIDEDNESDDDDDDDVRIRRKRRSHGRGNAPFLMDTETDLSILPRAHLVALLAQVSVLSNEQIASFVRVPQSLEQLETRFRAMRKFEVQMLGQMYAARFPGRAFARGELITLEDEEQSSSEKKFENTQDNAVVILDSDDDEDDDSKGKNSVNEKEKKKEAENKSTWLDYEEGNAEFWGTCKGDDEGSKKEEQTDVSEKTKSKSGWDSDDPGDAEGWGIDVPNKKTEISPDENKDKSVGQENETSSDQKEGSADQNAETVSSKSMNGSSSIVDKSDSQVKTLPDNLQENVRDTTSDVVDNENDNGTKKQTAEINKSTDIENRDTSNSDSSENIKESKSSNKEGENDELPQAMEVTEASDLSSSQKDNVVNASENESSLSENGESKEKKNQHKRTKNVENDNEDAAKGEEDQNALNLTNNGQENKKKETGLKSVSGSASEGSDEGECSTSARVEEKSSSNKSCLTIQLLEPESQETNQQADDSMEVDGNSNNSDDVICIESESAEPTTLHSFLTRQSSNRPPVISKMVRFMSNSAKNSSFVRAMVGLARWDKMIHFNFTGDPVYLPTVLAVSNEGEDSSGEACDPSDKSDWIYERVYPPIRSLVPGPNSQGALMRQRIRDLPYLDAARLLVGKKGVSSISSSLEGDLQQLMLNKLPHLSSILDTEMAGPSSIVIGDVRTDVSVATDHVPGEMSDSSAAAISTDKLRAYFKAFQNKLPDSSSLEDSQNSFSTLDEHLKENNVSLQEESQILKRILDETTGDNITDKDIAEFKAATSSHTIELLQKRLDFVRKTIRRPSDSGDSEMVDVTDLSSNTKCNDNESLSESADTVSRTCEDEESKGSDGCQKRKLDDDECGQSESKRTKVSDGSDQSSVSEEKKAELTNDGDEPDKGLSERDASLDDTSPNCNSSSKQSDTSEKLPSLKAVVKSSHKDNDKASNESALSNGDSKSLTKDKNNTGSSKILHPMFSPNPECSVSMETDASTVSNSNKESSITESSVVSPQRENDSSKSNLFAEKSKEENTKASNSSEVPEASKIDEAHSEADTKTKTTTAGVIKIQDKSPKDSSKSNTSKKSSEAPVLPGSSQDNQICIGSSSEEEVDDDDDDEEEEEDGEFRPGKKYPSVGGIHPFSTEDDKYGDMFVVANSSDEEDGSEGNQEQKSKAGKWRPCIKKDPLPAEEKLHLMLEEAFFLSYGLGCLRIFDPEMKLLSLCQMWQQFQVLKEQFMPHYMAYHYFRSKGWVPKSGLKFGCDFILYREGPPFYHGSYSVIVVGVKGDDLRPLTREDGLNFDERKLSWISLAGLNRITEHVAKELMVCYVIWPKGLTQEEGLSPKCISRFKVKEVVISRWVSSQERENKNGEEEMP